KTVLQAHPGVLCAQGSRQRGELVHLVFDLIDDVAGAWDSLGPTDARLAGS
ncbi:MAG: hypothetical protein QOF27_2877, partial [Gaiellaceae bacterium]|nr:hypothetical protein [Gaiellaceae bacterium]